MRSRYFFATASDLLPGLARFEEARPVRYVPTGLFDSETPNVFDAGSLLPDFGRARSGDAVLEPAFLVLRREAQVAVRKVPQRSGGLKFAIDQVDNPDSTVFRPGGVHQELVLIAGEIATTGTTAAAEELHRLMVRTVTRGFKRVQAFWLGPEAWAMMSRGARLTRSVGAPTLYDLRKEDDCDKKDTG